MNPNLRLHVARSELAITDCKFKVTKESDYFQQGHLHHLDYKITVYVAPFDECSLVALQSDSDAVNKKIELVFGNEDEELFYKELLGLGERVFLLDERKSFYEVRLSD